jgi:hypothetical protein
MDLDGFLTGLYGDRLPLREENDLWTEAIVRMFMESPLFAISNFFQIPDKQKRLTYLKPFALQAIIDLCIEVQYRNQLPQRVAAFKPRQVGSSSWLLARCVHRTCAQENRSAMFLVPDEDVCNKMSTRMGAMLNSLPRFLQAMRRIHNLKHLYFDNPNAKDRMADPGLNSEIQITVPSAMRGIPPDMLVISEYSHMKEHDQYQISESILPGMAPSEYTCAVIDTTPNGYDEFYYPLIMEAMEANPKWRKKLEDSPRSYTAAEILAGAIGVPENLYQTEYLVAFARWDWHEEYTIRSAQYPRGEVARKPPAAIWREFQAGIGKDTPSRYGGDEEIDLRERFGVSDEQLYWRRKKIDSTKMPSNEMRLATFHQEFPISIEGGFVELEKTPFARDSVEALVRMRKNPSARGLLDRNDKGDIGIRRSDSIHHEWRIYAPPESGVQYAMGVDTNQAYESVDSDHTAMAIMRWPDYKLVALYVGKVPEHILRVQALLAYQWYNRAYIGVETEGMGYQLVRSLIKMKVSNYYSWKRTDKAHPEPSDFPGWQTDDRTRPLMDSTFIECLCWRDPDTDKPAPKMIIQDDEAIKQIQGIRRGDSGSLKHAHGKDDIFDAICICLCLFQDPWGGFHQVKTDGPTKEQVQEFEGLFKHAMPRSSSRNRPTLARL